MNKNHPIPSEDANSALTSRALAAGAPISRRTALALGATAAAASLLSSNLFAASDKRKVVVWSEGTANVDPGSKDVYPHDINTAIAEGLKPLESEGWEVIKASINDP